MTRQTQKTCTQQYLFCIMTKNESVLSKQSPKASEAYWFCTGRPSQARVPRENESRGGASSGTVYLRMVNGPETMAIWNRNMMMNHDEPWDFKAFWKNVSHFRVSLHCGYLHRRCFLMGIHSLLGMWCLGRVLLWYNKETITGWYGSEIWECSLQGMALRVPMGTTRI